MTKKEVILEELHAVDDVKKEFRHKCKFCEKSEAREAFDRLISLYGILDIEKIIKIVEKYYPEKE